MNEKTVNGVKDTLLQIRNTLETASHLQDMMITDYFDEAVYPEPSLLMRTHKGCEIVTRAVMDYLEKAYTEVQSACELVGVAE